MPYARLQCIQFFSTSVAFCIPAMAPSAAVGVLLALFLGAAHGAHCGRECRRRCGTCAWLRCLLRWWAQRLLLVAINWSDLRRHPAWMLALAMIHHPLLAAVRERWRAWWRRCSMRAGSSCRWRPQLMRWLRPLALGLAFEQLGALLAGVGLRNRNSSALGGYLYAIHWRALERDAAGHSAASGAGLCGAGLF